MKKIRTWWFLALAGLLLLAVGIWCLADPHAAYAGIARFSGYVLVLNGLLLVTVTALPSTYEREKKWLSAESVLDLCFAVILLFTPVFTAIALPFIVGYWILGRGILKIVASLTLATRIQGWIFIGLTGILAIIFGWLIVNLPLAKLYDSTHLIGFFGLSMGALTLFDAYRFRRQENTLNLFF